MSAFPLHKAAEKGDLASVRSIANPANVNTRDDKGRTALHYAASSSSEHAAEVVKTLIENGAKLDVQDKDGRTPLHYAAMFSEVHAPGVVKTLIENEAAVSATDSNGKTPLHYAARRSGAQAPEVVKTLIDSGADVVERTHDGMTPLHYAAMSPGAQAPEVVKTLIESEAAVSATDSVGITPLHIAVSSYFRPSLEVVRTLIDKGGLVNAKTHGGTTPLDSATLYLSDRTAEVVKILRDNGAIRRRPMTSLASLSSCRDPAAFKLGDEDVVLGSRKLGSGACGSVYSGELRDGTDVAVKVYRYGGQDEEDLRKEVGALAALASCQHIAVLYGYHIDEAGEMFLVMEKLEHDLLSVIERGKERNQLPCVELPNFYAWLLGAAKGLKHMHDRGYVHRDIKPENIMVDGNNVAKLVDMGSAKKVGTQCFSDTASGTTLSQNRSTFGTGPYKAPEVLDSRGSAAADVYSLGRTAWVMIIGDTDYTQLCLPDGLQLPPAIMALIVSMTQEDVQRRPDIDAVISTLETYAAPGTQQRSQDVPVTGVYAVATHSTGGETRVTVESGGSYAVGRDPSESLGSRDAGPSASCFCPF